MSVNKSEVIKKHQQDAKDTGSPEVQVALISARVTHLTEHLRTHRKDFHSRRGLIMLTNRRRKLLAYLKSSDLDRYNALLAKLNLRKGTAPPGASVHRASQPRLGRPLFTHPQQKPVGQFRPTQRTKQTHT